MGLRSSLPALRRELQEKLENALESEVQGSADSNGNLSTARKKRGPLSGDRLGQNASQRGQLSNSWKIKLLRHTRREAL